MCIINPKATTKQQNKDLQLIVIQRRRENRIVLKYSVSSKKKKKKKTKGRKNIWDKYKMILLNLIISIIQLNVNGLNTLINRQALSDQGKRKIPLYPAYKKHTSNVKL